MDKEKEIYESTDLMTLLYIHLMVLYRPGWHYLQYTVITTATTDVCHASCGKSC